MPVIARNNRKRSGDDSVSYPRRHRPLPFPPEEADDLRKRSSSWTMQFEIHRRDGISAPARCTVLRRIFVSGNFLFGGRRFGFRYFANPQPSSMNDRAIREYALIKFVLEFLASAVRINDGFQ